MLGFLLAALIGQAPVGKPAPVPDVTRLSFAGPTAIAEIDASRVQGDPVGLAWNTDGTIYLRVTQGKDKTRHYLIQTVPAVSVAQCDEVPAWAAAYWTWKSSASAPEDPTFKLDVEQRQERRNVTNVSSGSGLAGNASGLPPTGGGDRGGESMSQSVAAAAALNSMMVSIVTMRYRGQVVGEWVGSPPQPGVRFGWAPAPMGLLAYTDAGRRLVVIDRAGKTLRVPGATDALLPAWSLDGTRLVYLQQKNAQTYVLMVAALQ